MAYISLFGIFVCLGLVGFGVTKSDDLRLFIEVFALIVGAYKASATYDDHSARKHTT